MVYSSCSLIQGYKHLGLSGKEEVTWDVGMGELTKEETKKSAVINY